MSFHTRLLHQGMVIVGVRYSEQRLVNMDEITRFRPGSDRFQPQNHRSAFQRNIADALLRVDNWR